MKPVLVTGASGFIGRAVVDRFLRDGVPVRALVRAPIGALDGAEIVLGDVLDLDLHEALTRGTSGVIHLAGRVHQEGERGEIAARTHDAHVHATRSLAQHASAVGSTRFLFMSTIAVYGPQDSPLHENLNPCPDTLYGMAKLAAERALEEVAAQSGLAVGVVRPPGVYGPGMKGAPLRLFDRIAREKIIPLPGDPVVRALVNVRNLVGAVSALWSRIDPGVLRVVVADPEQLSVHDLVHRAAEASELRSRVVRVPSLAVRAAGVLGDGLAHLRLGPALTSKDVDRLLRPVAIDDRFLRNGLGFRPPVSVDEALAETVAWALRRIRGDTIA